MKQMKHILSCILVLVFMLASVSVVTSFAADEPTLILDSAEAEAGGTVTLEINLENNPGVMAMQIYVKYDKTALTLPSTSTGQKNGDLFEVLSKGVSPTFYNTEEDAVDDGLVGTLIFTVNENAAPGEYVVELQILSAGNYDVTLSKDDFTVVNGTITVLGEPEPTTATVNATATVGGSVAGAGEFEIGAEATLTATPDAGGYKFAGWYNGETLVSTDATYTFTVEANADLTAKFEKITYSVAVDGNENVLNPYFVNDVVWVESNGGIKMPADTLSSFLLFDNALANNRVEATIDNVTLSWSGDDRNGIVFAFTDIEGDHTWADNSGSDIAYYWVCLSGTNYIELWEMGAYQRWEYFANASVSGLGLDINEGITIAVEWDANGHIKVFANGILAIDFVDESPLDGNLYGTLVRRYSNRPGSENPETYTDIFTSFVAGGANATKDENVTITVDPEVGGTVTGAGDYYLGQNVTVTATPNAGYNFAGWYWNGNLVSSELTFTFPAGDYDLVAKFTNITYNVTVNAGANGTAAGTGTYAEGVNVTVTATPNVGYKFVGWYVDDVKKSSDAAYTFTATADVTLVAEFEKVEYTVATDAQGNLLNPYYMNDNTWTEENGTMKPAVGPMENFILFDNALNANRIEATFTGLPANNDNNTRHGIVFAVTDVNNDHLTGINDGGATYYWVCVSGYGEVQLIGFPDWKNYTTGGNVDLTKEVTLAVEWDADGNVKVFANGNLVIEKNVGEPLTGNLYGVLMRSYANTLNSHTCLLNSFVAGNNTANLTVSATEGGVVTGAGEYEIGKGATLTATANDGYKFLGWFIGDELVSEAATFIYTVEADAEIVAKFEALVYYDVTVDATEGGDATCANTVLAGNAVRVIATPNAGYHFLGWFVNGEIVSTETTYEFAPTADIALEARFEKDEEPAAGLETEVESESGETVTGVTVNTDKDSYTIGDEFTVTVNVTNSEYMFIGWYQDGIFRSADLTYTATYFEGVSLIAMVVKKPENNGFAYIFGYTDEVMGAEGSLLRGEAAQIIYRLFSQAGLAKGSEVDADNWFNNGLVYVNAKGLWSTADNMPYMVVTKGEIYKIICIGYGLTTDGSLSNEEYAVILKNAGYIDNIDTDGDMLRWEFCEIINKITGRDQYELLTSDGKTVTAEDYGFTDLDSEASYYKTMLIAASKFTTEGYVDLNRGNRDELDKVKKDEE